MDEKKLKEMEDLMGKIKSAMYLSKKKNANIKRTDTLLHKETAVVKAEEQKEKIEELKDNKEEFDEMTVNALINMKREIMEARKEVQNEYEQNLLESLEKRREVDLRLKKMKERNNDNIEMVESSYNKAVENINKRNIEIHEKYNNNINKLDEWEANIQKYATELDVLDKLDEVSTIKDIDENTAKEEEKEQEENVEEKVDLPEENKEENKDEIDDLEEPDFLKENASIEEDETEVDKEPQEEKIVIPQPRRTQETVNYTDRPKTVTPKKEVEQAETNKSTQTETKKPVIELKIGNTGKLVYKGKEYNLDTLDIRTGLYLNQRFKNGEDLKGDLPEVMKKIELLKIEKDSPIDFTVVTAIAQIKEKNIQSEIIEAYLTNVMKSQFEKKLALKERLTVEEGLIYEDNQYAKMDIVYDMDDISKPRPFWKTLFSRNPEKDNLTGEEKQQLVEIGNKASRYGLGKTIGQYKYQETGIKAKILNLFKKNRKLLPEPEKMHTVDMTTATKINRDGEEISVMANRDPLKVEWTAAKIYDKARTSEQNAPKRYVVSNEKEGRVGMLTEEEYHNLSEEQKSKLSIEEVKRNHRDFVKDLRVAKENEMENTEVSNYTDVEKKQIENEVNDLGKEPGE